ARGMIPALVRALEDPKNRMGVVAEALVAIGRPAVTEVTGALNHKQEKVRAAAAEILGEIGAPAKTALPGLEGMLTDSSPLVRVKAAAAVQRIGPPNPKATALVLAAVEDKDVAVRKAAIYALWNQPALTKEAVPALAKHLNDTNGVVR